MDIDINKLNEEVKTFGGQTYNKDRKADAMFYLQDASNKIQNTLNWNEKEDWSVRQRKYLYEILKPKSIELKEIIETIIQIPEQEKKLEEIQKQLEITPVPTIRIELAEKGLFTIINAETGKILFTETAEVTKRIIEGMSKMQVESEVINNEE